MEQGVSLGAPHSVTLNRHQAGELRIVAKEQKKQKVTRIGLYQLASANTLQPSAQHTLQE